MTEKRIITKESVSFSRTIHTQESPETVFNIIKDVKAWWSGIFNEEITGQSEKVGDEFSFYAGGGVHFSKQQLVEAIPYEKLVWAVIESELNFLEKTNEWTGSKLGFEISKNGDQTQVKFIHYGLVPELECFDSCTSAWTNYMENLQSKLA